MTGLPPASLAASSASTFGRDYAAVLGIVSVAQIAFTRTDRTWHFNPPLTPASDQSTIPLLQRVFQRYLAAIKPSLTLTYGIGWTLEMPPVEKNGSRSNWSISRTAVDTSPTSPAPKRRAPRPGLQSNVGFALVGNTGPGQKYPYDPFYGGFSPRIASPGTPAQSDSILGNVFGHGRPSFGGGYSRVFGRLNGVDLVLVPLLGTGLSNQSSAYSPPPIPALRWRWINSQTGAFRVGPTRRRISWSSGSHTRTPTQFADAADYPGINRWVPELAKFWTTTVPTAATLSISPSEAIVCKTMFEVGYIGRIMHDEYQPININSVPYMMTLGGQSFAQGYAGIQQSLGCAGPSSGCGTNGVPAKHQATAFLRSGHEPGVLCWIPQLHTSCRHQRD